MEHMNDAAMSGQPDEMQLKYMAKLAPLVQYHGFSQLRIDAIVRAMDISKATFYKHFTSKEDVIAHGVNFLITYLQETTTLIDDSAIAFEVRFQQVFEQSLLLATYLTDVFLHDLQQAYPPLWEQIKEAQRERQRHLATFFADGVAAGIFQSIPQMLVLVQEEVLLRRLLDPLFLMEHDLTLRSALEAYYELQKYQWCVATVRERLDDTSVKAYIVHMAGKIALSMRADAQR